MCLDRPATKSERIMNFQYTKSNDGSFIGFKLFKYSKLPHGSNFRNKKLFGQIIPSKPIPIGKWIHENDLRPFPTKNTTCFYYPHKRKKYTIGFHIYVHEKDAKRLELFYINVIKRAVKFRNIVQTGYQQGIPIVVAKEMLILPLRKKENN